RHALDRTRVSHETLLPGGQSGRPRSSPSADHSLRRSRPMDVSFFEGYQYRVIWYPAWRSLLLYPIAMTVPGNGIFSHSVFDNYWSRKAFLSILGKFRPC